jgi:hypothetical protein
MGGLSAVGDLSSGVGSLRSNPGARGGRIGRPFFVRVGVVSEGEAGPLALAMISSPLPFADSPLAV